MQAIYARQSREKQDSLSIETQIELCRQEIGPDERCKVYIDRGFSGKDTDRPKFIEMMDDIKKGVITKVTVYKVDRLSRSILDFANMMDLFRAHNVGFQSAREKFDTATPMGNAMLNIIMVFAQLERETIQLRIKDNFYSRMSKGAYDAKAPFGYEKTKFVVNGKKMSTITPHPENMLLVQEIFQRYAYDDCSLGELARDFNKRNIPSPNGATYWDSAKLSRIMANPIYVCADADVHAYFTNNGIKIINSVDDFIGEHGCITYGKWDRKRRKFSQLDQLELSIGLHEGIIDSITFLKCQYKLESNKQVRNIGKGKHTWLSGLMKCAYCGKSLKVIHSSSVDKTACSGQYNYGICNSYTKRWPIPELEDRVETLMLERIRHKLDLVKRTAMLIDRKEAEYKARLTKIDFNIECLVDATANGSNITAKYLNTRFKELETQKRAINLEYQQYSITKETEDEDSRLAHILDNWSTMSLDERAHAAKMMINRITIGNTEDSICIDWKYNFMEASDERYSNV